MDWDDYLWGMYQEHTTQARQHENQRERITAAVLVLGGALVLQAAKTKDIDIVTSFALSIAATVVGVYGTCFNVTHYRRNRVHVGKARGFRQALEIHLEGPPPAGFARPTEPDFSAASAHGALHLLWAGLPLCVALIGTWMGFRSACVLWCG